MFINISIKPRPKYQIEQWLIFEIGSASLIFVAAALFPSRIFTVVAIVMGIVCALFAFYKPFIGLVLLLSIQPLIFIIKRLQFIQVGIQAEFNNPISLLPQFIIVFLLARILINAIYCNKIRRPPSIFFWAIVIMGMYIFGAIYAPSIMNGIFSLRAVLFPMLLIFVGRSLVKTRDQLKYILLILSITAVAIGAYGLKQALIGFYPFEYNWAVQFSGGLSNIAWFLRGNGQSYLRIFSIVSSPFDLAGITMLAPFLLFPLYFSNKSLLGFIVFILSTSIILGALIVTAIRGAWIGFIMAALVFFFFYRTRGSLDTQIVRGFLRIIIFVFISAVFFIAITTIQGGSHPIISRLQSLSNIFETQNMLSRYGHWADAFDIVLRNPFGLGAGSSGYLGRRFGNQNAISPDSLYIQALIELGWQGPLLFFALFITAIIHYFRQYFTLRSVFLRNVNLAIMAIIIAISIHGFTTPLQEAQMTISWFWLFLGIGTNLKQMDNYHDE